MASTATRSSTPSSGAATASEPRPSRRRLTDSLRWRVALTLAGLLAIAGGVLLIVVNVAARVATVPVETVHIPDPVSGFVYTQQYVDARTAAARAQTLDRLRFYSILAFAVLAAAGLVIGWVVSGRALRPVARMAEVARRVSERNLKERIALPGPPDDELKQLADSFDAMVARLDDAFERERQFVADASHELRTPLTTLRLSVDSVRADPSATVDDYRRLADEAATATERMRRLVEDLLALADDSPPPPARDVAVAPLCESVLEELAPLAERRRIGLVVEVPAGLVARVDPGSLQRVLRNLVENAIRYDRDGGYVVVEGAAAPDDQVAVAVRDNGIGIPAEELTRIFDRFHRVDPSRSRSEGGSGLGLSIVATLVARMGGRVTVESMVGEGSRFIVTVPAAAPLPAPSRIG